MPSNPADHPQVRWPGLIPLRPLSIGEILGLGLRLGRRNLPVLAPLALVAAVLSAAALVGMLTVTGGFDDYLRYTSGALDPASLGNSAQATQMMWTVLLAAFGSAVVSQLTAPFLAGVAAPLVGQAALGTGKGRRPLARLTGRWWVLVGVAVTSGLAVTAGLVALIVPGILIWLALLPAGPVAAMEGTSVVVSIRRAAALSAGFRARLFGVLLLTALVAGGADLVVTALVDQVVSTSSAVGAFYLDQAVGAVTGGITGTWTATVTALLYTDLRMRKEDLGRSLWDAAHRDSRSG